MQEKKVISQEDYITRADVDMTNVYACDHAVVIGSESLGGAREGYSKRMLIIKDSSLVTPWAVDSIDVMVFPGAEVRWATQPCNINNLKVTHGL